MSTTCTTTVPPSSSCVFVLSYQSTVAGTNTGSFTLFSNDPVHPQTIVALSGTTLTAYTGPTITGLRPTAIPLNSAATQLSVSGSNFFPASYIVVDGEPLHTTFVNSSTLTAMVDASLLTSVGELPVTVVNPAPGGASASTPLPVFRSLAISAASLIYEPVSKLLYVSIQSSATNNANTVVSIDPVSGTLGKPIPVGNNPGKLAVAADGSTLYVGVNGAHTLQRINLATQQVDRTFALPIDSLAGATTIYDMHVVPGSALSVAVSLSRPASPAEAGAALYNDAGLVSFVPNTFQTHNYSLDSFTFTASPDTFYGFPFASSFFGVTQVSSSALTPVTAGFSCCTQLTGSLIASDGTLLYTNSGQIWNPVSQTLLGTLTPTSVTYPLAQFFYEPSVVPDLPTGRTFFLDAFVNGDSIFAFNSSSFAQTGVLSIPEQNYPSATDLVRWGADGFAFRLYDTGLAGSPNGQIVLLRSSLAQTGTSGTPGLTTLSPANAAAGSATFTLTLQGSSFIPGSQVLWNGSARQTTFVSATQLTSIIPSTDLSQAGTAQILVRNPGGGNSPPRSFAINGPPLTLSSQAFSFGSQTQGVASAPMTLTLTNAGTVPASLSALSYPITGSNAADFIVSTTCGTTLAAGAQCTFTVVFKPTTTSAESATLTLSAAGQSLPVVALTGTGVVPDFAFTASGITSVTVSTGQSATYSLVLTPLSGFSGSVVLACANLPAHASCSFSPASSSVSAPTPITVTVATHDTIAGNVSASHLTWAAFFPIGTLLGVFLGKGRRKNKRCALFSVTLTFSALALASSLAGCGGSTPTSPPLSATTTTQAGTYTFTVSSTSGSNSHSIPLTLVVQ